MHRCNRERTPWATHFLHLLIHIDGDVRTLLLFFEAFNRHNRQFKLNQPIIVACPALTAESHLIVLFAGATLCAEPIQLGFANVLDSNNVDERSCLNSGEQQSQGNTKKLLEYIFCNVRHLLRFANSNMHCQLIQSRTFTLRGFTVLC